MMEVLEEGELCFAHLINTSCRRPVRQHALMVFFHVLVLSMSFITVVLNLLVLISISHFRQLHTPTNILLLSLAVSDLLVGLLVMPVGIQNVEGCWLLGRVMCVLIKFISFIITSASVGNMVLISVDRHVAICDPLSYATKVTNRRAEVFVCLSWGCSVSYNAGILFDFLTHLGSRNSCEGECVYMADLVTGAVDMVVTFLGPVTIIVVLYMRVFVVALAQARALRSHVKVQGSVQVSSRKSERKAARTLGVIVVIFLVCYCPYFFALLIGQDISSNMMFFFGWLLYCNSCLNPLVYAFFYPWFRRSIRLIITLQILQPGSSSATLL